MLDAAMERDDVVRNARKENKRVHFANIMELSSVKHAELPPEFQKCNGRVVVQGDNMKNESGLATVFVDAASSASHIEASRLCDATALLPGNGGQ
eukprot:5675462-Pyramimonas_sp.AAC.1